MINFKQFMKLESLLANIKRNYPRMKICVNCDLFSSSCSLYIKYGKNKLVTAFNNLGSCLLCLNFLYNAKFSGLALKSIKKRKPYKRKINLFFWWLEKGNFWGDIEAKTLGELWEEFDQEITPQEEPEGVAVGAPEDQKHSKEWQK